jgi:hypothetical protein
MSIHLSLTKMSKDTWIATTESFRLWKSTCQATSFTIPDAFLIYACGDIWHVPINYGQCCPHSELPCQHDKHVPFYTSSSVHSQRWSFWAESQLQLRTSPQVTSNVARNVDTTIHTAKKLFDQNNLSWTDVSWDIIYVAQDAWRKMVRR